MSSAQESTIETAAPTAADIAHSNTLMSADELAAMNDTGDEAELLAKRSGLPAEAGTLAYCHKLPQAYKLLRAFRARI
jgi:hypothetical protein